MYCMVSTKQQVFLHILYAVHVNSLSNTKACIIIFCKRKIHSCLFGCGVIPSRVNLWFARNHSLLCFNRSLVPMHWMCSSFDSIVVFKSPFAIISTRATWIQEGALLCTSFKKPINEGFYYKLRMANGVGYSS